MTITGFVINRVSGSAFRVYLSLVDDCWFGFTKSKGGEEGNRVYSGFLVYLSIIACIGNKYNK